MSKGHSGFKQRYLDGNKVVVQLNVDPFHRKESWPSFTKRSIKEQISMALCCVVDQICNEI